MSQSHIPTEPNLEDPELDAPIAIDPPRIDEEAVYQAILGTWPKQRLMGRAIAKNPEFWRDDLLAMPEHRERVLGQLKQLVTHGTTSLSFPKSVGGEENFGGNIAAFEEVFLADPSLQIKSGVQFGLFGGAIHHLGTEKHHKKWLPQVMSMELPGIYAMTETGHGSDVSAVGTTATYDPETEEFLIHTPFRGAWKDYLGNAAKNGRAAVVFAQLITLGVNHGVHAFFVPVRDEEGNFLPGVGGEDDGVKGGLNGIDNGRLHFTQVRIPRENLLNRYGDVAADGTYSSEIESPGRRFFVMLGTLVQGRVSLDGSAAVASQAALDIAITYANQRRQFDNTHSGRETVLLDYQRHQRRLLPRLATAFASTFAHDEFLRQFDAVFSGREDTPENRADLETLAAALKSVSTWQAMDLLQDAREACGGAGFLAENRIALLHHDLDVYTTFEGDNTILLQLVGKRLLDDFAAQFRGADKRATARIVATQAASKAFHTIGLARLRQTITDFGQAGRSVGFLRLPETQHELLKARVEEQVAQIGMKLARSQKGTAAEQAAAFNSEQNELIETAQAYGELIQWEAFTRKLETFPQGSQTRRVMTWLRDLFGLTLIEKNLGWYLLNGRLTRQRAQLVSSYINRLLTQLRPHAQSLVDAFRYDDDALRAKIATGVEAQRQEEAHDYFTKLRASGDAPQSEHELYRAKRKAEREAAKAAKAAAK